MKTTSSHTGGTLTRGVCSSILLAAAKQINLNYGTKDKNSQIKVN